MQEKVAVILAGGKGTRLRPYTVVLPKPLVPVGDKPILELIIMQLAKQEFKRIIIAVNHQADIIMAYFGNGQKWGVSIEYSLEKKPLGTMGPLKLLRNLPKSFLVMNGDVLTDLDYGRFLRDHEDSGRFFTIASHQRVQKIDYGILDIDGEVLAGFREKPNSYFCVSMGVYAVSEDILEYIPKDVYFGFDDLMLRMLQDGMEVGVIPHSGYWMDIGRPDDYEQAIDDIKNGVFSC